MANSNRLQAQNNLENHSFSRCTLIPFSVTSNKTMKIGNVGVWELRWYRF